MKRKTIYAIALLLGLSLFSFYAKAQNWQAYKGIWLKGYDNVPQAPLPPSGYSALTYFADSLGTYVYDWDSLAWLRIPGTGGGAGLTTANNGLNVSPAGNVKWGGTLIEPTFITYTGNDITLQGDLSAAFFSDDGFGYSTIHDTGTYGISVDPQDIFGYGQGTVIGELSGGGAKLELTSTGANMLMGLNPVMQYNTSSVTISKPTVGLGGTLFMNNTLSRLQTATSSGIESFQLGPGETATIGSSLGSTFTFNTASTTNAIMSSSNQFTLEGSSITTNATNNTTINSGSTSGNQSKSVFTPTTLQLAVTDNFTFSNTFDLNATSWNINIPGANFSANAGSAIWTQGSGGQSTSIELRHSTESAELRSTVGSTLTANVSSPTSARVESSGNIILEVADATGVAFETTTGGNFYTASRGTGITAFNMGHGSGATERSTIVLTGRTSNADDHLSLETNNAITGNNVILSPSSDLQINVSGNDLIFTITRTDCTGAPSGAIANISGVLNICP